MPSSSAHLSRHIDNIKREMGRKQIAVDAKENGLTSAERVRLIKDIGNLEGELVKLVRRRDDASSCLHGMEGGV